MTRKPNTSSRAGFTLIELMVSMVAGLVVIAGVWSTAGMSSRMFNEQLRRSETQTSLRSATDSLTRDIGRAGLFSLSNSANPRLNTCGGAAQLSSVPVQAVRVTLDANQNHVLTLMGNFATSYQFPAISDNIVPPFNILSLSNTSHSFADSFMPTVAGIATYDANAFSRTFLPDPTGSPAAQQGRMLSVFHLPTGMTFLRMISSVTAAGPTPTITLDAALPVGVASGGCLNDLRYIAVAPISMYSYSIVPSTVANLAGIGTGTGPRNVLVRQELNISTGLPITTVNTMRVVCDYARSFRLTAVMDRALPGQPPTLVRQLNPEAEVVPQDFRSLIVEIQADMQGDTTVAAQADPVSAGRQLNARRSVRFEVFMPNMVIQ